MIRKFKNLILLAVTGSTLFAPMLLPSLASAATVGTFASLSNNITKGVCQGVNNATSGTNGSGCGTAGTGAADLSSIATKIINILSIIVGIIAVVMIIYGGFKYITSGGDTGNVSGAKNTLIFALVGLVIVGIAQFIVHFVLNTSTGAVTQT